MTGKSNKYTEEYRRECADYALASDKSITQVAEELGINVKTFSNWVAKRCRELSGEKPQSIKMSESDRELRVA